MSLRRLRTWDQEDGVNDVGPMISEAVIARCEILRPDSALIPANEAEKPRYLPAHRTCPCAPPRAMHAWCVRAVTCCACRYRWLQQREMAALDNVRGGGGLGGGAGGGGGGVQVGSGVR